MKYKEGDIVCLRKDVRPNTTYYNEGEHTTFRYTPDLLIKFDSQPLIIARIVDYYGDGTDCWYDCKTTDGRAEESFCESLLRPYLDKFYCVSLL